MKYPSQLLHDLADQIDVLEDQVENILKEKDWKVWEWPRYREEAQMWKRRAEAINKDYMTLRRLYREKTDEDPPKPSTPVQFYMAANRLAATLRRVGL